MPPWVIVSVEASGIASTKVAGLGDFERPPQLLVGRRRACRNARLEATVPVKR